MDDIFLLVEHSRDLDEVHVLGWFASEAQARAAAEALEWQARSAVNMAGEPALEREPGHRRYWVKGIGRFQQATLAGSATVH